MDSYVTKFVRAMLMSALVFTTIFSIAGRDISLSGQANPLHTWAGALLLVVTGFHTLSNRKWLTAVFSKPAGTLSRRLRWLRRINLGMMLFWTMNAATSVIMLFHRDAAIPHQLAHLHHVSGELFILTIGLHMLLHWKWLVNVVGNLFSSRNKKSANRMNVSSK